MSKLRLLGRLRKFNGQSNFEDWAKTELTQNFKAIEDGFRRSSDSFTYGDDVTSFSESSTSEKNIASFSVTIQTDRFDVLDIGICPTQKLAGSNIPSSNNLRMSLYFSDTAGGTYGFGGLSVKRKRQNSDEAEVVVFNIQSSGYGPIQPTSGFSFFDQPGEGTFKYYCSYVTLDANTYLTIANMKMFIKKN